MFPNHKILIEETNMLKIKIKEIEGTKVNKSKVLLTSNKVQSKQLKENYIKLSNKKMLQNRKMLQKNKEL